MPSKKSKRKKKPQGLYVKRWYGCWHCDKVREYLIRPNGTTTIPKGHWVICQTRYDSIVTGLRSEAEAQRYVDYKMGRTKKKPWEKRKKKKGQTP